MSSLTEALQLGIDILSTALGETPDSPTGAPVAQTGDVLKQTVDTDNVELWQQSGFWSRPARPVAGKSACQGLIIRQGSRDVCFATRDVRTTPIFGNLNDGETVVFAVGPDGTGQARTIYKFDGSITHLTTDDNTASGNNIYLRIHPTQGLQFVAPWGTLTFDQAGFRVLHSSGASFQMGASGGLPISSLSSFIYLTAAQVKAEGGMTLLGTSDEGYSPVAWGLAENPLTMPSVPIAPEGYGIPCGLFTSNSVRVGG